MRLNSLTSNFVCFVLGDSTNKLSFELKSAVDAMKLMTEHTDVIGKFTSVI